MLTAEGCRVRRGRLLERLGVEDGFALISDAAHIYYLTGYLPSPHSLNWDAHNWLLLWPNGDTLLLVDNRQGGGARQAYVDRVETLKWHGLWGPCENRMRAMNAFLAETLKKEKITAKRLACEMERLPTQAGEALAEARLPRPSIDATPALEQMRRAKDPDELDVIGRNIAMAEAIHAASRDLVEPGMTEWELYRALHAVALEAAGEEIVMRCDVTGSPRPNREPRLGMTLEEGCLVILDMFALMSGYRADITNTLSVGGRPTARQMGMFALCEAAMAAGEAALRPGARACDVYEAVRAAFAEAGQADLFPHHAGHGIGLNHPEAPFLVPGDKTELVEGDVITLEPGLYEPQAGGIRIENNYLITESGFRKLSNHRIGL